MDKQKLIESLRGGLVVSCQALMEEPLHSSFIMSKMALAGQRGGAVGIRANGLEDIKAIKQEVQLPVIGIVKREYPDSPIFITATMKEVSEVVEAGAEIIAMDGTNRVRPNGKSLEELYLNIRKEYPTVLLMADISTVEEGIRASELGFDLIATTLSGYTDDTKDIPLPNTELVKSLSEQLDTPIMAEGGYWTLEDVEQALTSGAHGCIIGSAITRPMEITKRFVAKMSKVNSSME